MHATVTVAGLPKPESISTGERMPESSSTTAPASPTASGGNFSVKNATIMATTRPSTIQVSGVMGGRCAGRVARRRAYSRAAFSKVVLVEYPRPGIWAIAFITNNSGGEANTVTGQDLVAVFLPTTPNPTSGFLLLVPRSDVRELKMTVREGMKYIISGGAVLPDRLAETLETK